MRKLLYNFNKMKKMINVNLLLVSLMCEIRWIKSLCRVNGIGTFLTLSSSRRIETQLSNWVIQLCKLEFCLNHEGNDLIVSSAVCSVIRP